jgi:ribonuclease-3
MNEQQMAELQEKLNYSFSDPSLLEKSLTHSSYANEKIKNGAESNERMEFLGDSLLGMAVALLIYKNIPNLTEGQMTKLRAELICERSLAALAMKLGLGDCLLLGRGEENGGGRNRPSMLADAFEAMLAAIYLDGGYEPVEQFIRDFLNPCIKRSKQSTSDHKTRLQEIVQIKPGQSLVYEKTDEHGPDHEKLFTIVVKLNGKEIGTGTGRSKKKAEQEAAKAAIATMR